MRPRFRSQLKIVGSVLLVAIVYNECASYYLKRLEWARLECSEGARCVRALLVADPQILSERDDDPPLERLFVWDSNRYLAKTYAHATAHFPPDVVLFLGDLVYEGRINGERQFRVDVETLSSIFTTQYPIKHVWIPGDNDIGGENEPIYSSKVKQFNNAFGQPDYFEVGDVVFYKANSLIQKFPRAPPAVRNSNKTKIALSHMPLLLSPGRFTENVFLKLKPSVIFSGHKHAAFHLETTLDAMFVSKVVAMTPRDEDNVIRIDFKRDSYDEFVVPTCSYRMGVPNMGYGIAIIENSKFMLYTILWSPKRFDQIILYVILLASSGLYLILILICKFSNMFCRNTIHYSKV